MSVAAAVELAVLREELLEPRRLRRNERAVIAINGTPFVFMALCKLDLDLHVTERIAAAPLKIPSLGA